MVQNFIKFYSRSLRERTLVIFQKTINEVKFEVVLNKVSFFLLEQLELKDILSYEAH